jgi:outer membrane protein OmpA-like peptidoglycan-associated protein
MIKRLSVSLLIFAILCACSDEAALEEASQPAPVIITSQKIIEKPPVKRAAKKPRKVAIDSCKKIDRNLSKKSINKKPVQTLAASTTSFVVFFKPGTTKITPASNSVLKEMLEKLAAIKDYEIAIIDKSASSKDDARLSRKRIELVKARLAKAGSEKTSNNKIKHKVEIFLND